MPFHQISSTSPHPTYVPGNTGPIGPIYSSGNDVGVAGAMSFHKPHAVHAYPKPTGKPRPRAISHSYAAPNDFRPEYEDGMSNAPAAEPWHASASDAHANKAILKWLKTSSEASEDPNDSNNYPPQQQQQQHHQYPTPYPANDTLGLLTSSDTSSDQAHHPRLHRRASGDYPGTNTLSQQYPTNNVVQPRTQYPQPGTRIRAQSMRPGGWGHLNTPSEFNKRLAPSTHNGSPPRSQMGPVDSDSDSGSSSSAEEIFIHNHRNDSRGRFPPPAMMGPETSISPGSGVRWTGVESDYGPEISKRKFKGTPHPSGGKFRNLPARSVAATDDGFASEPPLNRHTQQHLNPHSAHHASTPFVQHGLPSATYQRTQPSISMRQSPQLLMPTPHAHRPGSRLTWPIHEPHSNQSLRSNISPRNSPTVDTSHNGMLAPYPTFLIDGHLVEGRDHRKGLYYPRPVSRLR